MLGTLLNFAGILLGGLAGLILNRDLPTRQQLLLKLLIGLALIWFGFKIALSGLLAGDWRYFGKLFLILLVSMIAGRMIGRLLRIQKGLNHLGHLAKEKLGTGNRNDGLLAAVILFCAAPLGFVGAIENGLANRSFEPLLIKGVIDGLAAMSFARMFGPRLLLAGLPVAALLAAISFGALSIEPWLRSNQMLDALHVVCGFLILYVSLIVFEIKKVELGDYLPAMLVAPAVAALFR
ncbi:MAG TPA: DUF554 family protein [Candidatus Acidoferrum sp.]|nr:DUF554 family protein [Candidatus Acidoferrum sp.]